MRSSAGLVLCAATTIIGLSAGCGARETKFPTVDRLPAGIFLELVLLAKKIGDAHPERFVAPLTLNGFIEEGRLRAVSMGRLKLKFFLKLGMS